MGRKNTLNNYAMFGAGANMATASTTSSSTNVQYTDNIGIVLAWTGSTPIGTITVQGSNDNTNWATLDFGSAISITGDSGTDLLNINQFPCSYIRIVYTKSSGTGTITASMTTKQIGG